MKKILAVSSISALLVLAAQPAMADGKQTYDTYCQACHNTGVAGAPKAGDKAAWEPRVAQGMEVLMNTAVNGKGAMPPKGTCMSCSDDELKAAIKYMVEEKTGLKIGG